MKAQQRVFELPQKADQIGAAQKQEKRDSGFEALASAAQARAAKWVARWNHRLKREKRAQNRDIRPRRTNRPTEQAGENEALGKFAL